MTGRSLFVWAAYEPRRAPSAPAIERQRMTVFVDARDCALLLLISAFLGVYSWRRSTLLERWIVTSLVMLLAFFAGRLTAP